MRISETDIRRIVRNSITEWINDEVRIDGFTPSTQWMQGKFNQFNKERFGNALPPLRLLLSKASHDTALGSFKYGSYKTGGSSVDKVLKNPRDNKAIVATYMDGTLMVTHTIQEIMEIQEIPSMAEFVKQYGTSITLYINYTMSEEDWECVLLHEMCHYYNFLNGEELGHGADFMRAVYSVADIFHDANLIATAENQDIAYNGANINTTKDDGVTIYMAGIRGCTAIFMSKNPDMKSLLYEELANWDECQWLKMGKNPGWSSTWKVKGYKFPKVPLSRGKFNTTVWLSSEETQVKSHEAWKFIDQTQWETIFDKDQGVMGKVEKAVKKIPKNLTAVICNFDNGQRKLRLMSRTSFNRIEGDAEAWNRAVEDTTLESVEWTDNYDLLRVLVDKGVAVRKDIFSRYYLVDNLDWLKDLVDQCEWETLWSYHENRGWW